MLLECCLKNDSLKNTVGLVRHSEVIFSMIAVTV